MRRFFLPEGSLSGQRIALDRELLRHMTVLRLKLGDEVLLLDGRGMAARCRLDALGRQEGLATVLERWRETESALPLQLLQGVPKGEKMDLVLQKGTELGVGVFSPVLTERTVPLRSGAARVERWRRIVSEAARQSRRPVLPRIDAPVPLAEALAGCQAELRLMLWEEGSLPLHEVAPANAPASAAILVGPEGGLSSREAAAAQAAGFLPVHLGARIMRTETAALAVSSVLQYLYGDWAQAPTGAVD